MEGETWYQAVVIGSSLGGIEALHTILSGLRTELRVPVVIANHLPPGLGRLSDTLSHTSRLPVAWAADGIRAEPGQVYLCPGRSEVRLEPDGTLTVGPGRSYGQVDELFASAARSLGERVLALVLTGTGNDGTAGAGAVKEAGGTVIVQNEATAIAFAMPGAVITAGHADLVVPLGEIPEILDRVITGGRLLPTAAVRAAEAITERRRREETRRQELERRIEEQTAALRDRDERYRALVKASAQVVWVTDAKGRVVEDSPGWREFTGQSHQQWLGWGWLDVVHPDDREHAGRQWREAAERGDQVEAQFRLWHAASGEWRLTQVRAQPLRNDDGSARGWIAVSTDVSAQP